MSKSQVTKLDKLARIRLSRHFFLRDFLYSETAAVHGINNIPDDIELAVEAGTQLCEKVLEPIQGVWVVFISARRFEAARSIREAMSLARTVPVMKVTTPVIFGTGAIKMALWALRPVLLSQLIWTITKVQAIGHHWLGGYMRIFRNIAISNSFQTYVRSMFLGTRTPRN